MNNISEWFKAIPNLYDWYSDLTRIKRLQLNYIIILITLSILSYLNDKQHRADKMDADYRRAIDDSISTQEKREDKRKLEFYEKEVFHLYRIIVEKNNKKEESIKENQ